MNLKKDLSQRLKRGIMRGGICAVITVIVLIFFRDNLSLGVVIAAPVAMLAYLISGRFFRFEDGHS